MRTIETKAYTFDELSDDAKAKAISRLSHINVEYDWWESTYEDAAQIGLKIEGFDLDRSRHAKGAFTLSATEVMANIFANHGEECETYKTAKAFEAEWQPLFDDYMDELSDKYESQEAEDDLSDIEDNFLDSLLEDYSIMLQKEYEHLQSEESIIETIVANEYEFTEEGKQI
jgi:hypothetical protein